MKRIAIACDHAGFETKELIINVLKNSGYEIKDFGAFSTESVDYPDFAHPLSEAIENGEFSMGIILCGTGNGINMTANKHQGIRSALCWNVEIALLARQHNDANVCAIPARFVETKMAIEIAQAFLNEDFEGGRHQRRVNKIAL